MNIRHKIIFACDNAEIDVKIDNEDELRKKIRSLDTLEEQKIYVRNLYSKVRKTNFVKESYLANYDLDEDNFLNDVRFIDGTKYKGKVDLFVGGSPCQSFSIMGHQKGLEDTRGTLFYDFARLVEEIEPKVFIYENVQGMLKHDNGNTWDIINNTLKSLGYNVFCNVLDAKDYGIPQTRRRVFVVGFKDDIGEFDFPPKLELDYTMQDFLETNVKFGGFKSINSNINIKIENGEVDSKYYISDKVLKHIMAPGTKGYYTKPEIDLTIARPLLSTMHKMHRAGIDNYVTCNGRIRKLTPRECLRLMGYDDTFKQVVSDTQMYRQCGNSIVVDVLINLMESIIKSYPQLLKGQSYNFRDNKPKKNKDNYIQLNLKSYVETVR